MTCVQRHGERVWSYGCLDFRPQEKRRCRSEISEVSYEEILKDPDPAMGAWEIL